MTSRTLLAVSVALIALGIWAAAPAQANSLHSFHGGFYGAPFGFGGFDFRPAGNDPATCNMVDRIERDDLGNQYRVRVRTCE